MPSLSTARYHLRCVTATMAFCNARSAHCWRQIWISALFRISSMTSFWSCVVCGKIISYLLQSPFMLNSIVALNRKPNHTWWVSRHFHVDDCIFIGILCQVQRIIATKRRRALRVCMYVETTQICGMSLDARKIRYAGCELAQSE